MNKKNETLQKLVVLSEVPKEQNEIKECKCGAEPFASSDFAYASISCYKCGQTRTLYKPDILSEEGKKTWRAVSFSQDVEQVCGDYLILEWAKQSDELGLGIYNVSTNELAKIKKAEENALKASKTEIVS